MLGKSIVQSLMNLVPNRCPATVILTPDYTARTITVYNAWLKPMDAKLNAYGGVMVQGDETIIHVPDHELNPTSTTNYEIRPRDNITVNGVTYNVISSRLKTVRTNWECVCREVTA